MKVLKPQYLLLGVALTFGLAAARAQDTPKPVIKSVPARATRTLDGMEMFRQYCAACHGESAKGNGPAAEALKKAPADLTQIARKNGGKFPKVQVMRVIEGSDVIAAHGNRPMPIWGNIFRSLENQSVATLRVNTLADYIENLQGN